MKEREKEKGVNFNVIKMERERERVTLEWTMKERRKRKEKRVTHFETWYPCLLWVMKKRERENKGWTIFEEVTLRCMKKERKEGDSREREREIIGT